MRHLDEAVLELDPRSDWGRVTITDPVLIEKLKKEINSPGGLGYPITMAVGLDIDWSVDDDANRIR